MGLSLCLMFGLKSTSLSAQQDEPALFYYGLWNDVHPFTLRLEQDLRGTLVYRGTVDTIRLEGKRTISGWTIAEVLPDGSLAGTWLLDRGRIATWMNYNQTLGARALLDKKPIAVPDLQIKLIQFRSTDGDWYLFLHPAPPARWRGIAWSNTHPAPLQVLGAREDQQFQLEVFDPDKPGGFRLEFSATRKFPRFGWWTSQFAVPEKIRFRHRKVVPIKVSRWAGFTGELLMLEPDLDWPAWQAFARDQVQPVFAQYEQQRADLEHPAGIARPYQRQAVRCYVWVTWSFLRDDLLSGVLHVAPSWGPARQTSFILHDAHPLPVSVADIWPSGLPRSVAELLPRTAPGDPAEWRDRPLELRPDGLYIGPAPATHIPTAVLRQSLARNSWLLPYLK